MDIKEIFNIVKTHMPITTDSRDCPEGSVFLALKGETFDGNKFAVSALQKGCAIAIVDNADIIGTSDEKGGVQRQRHRRDFSRKRQTRHVDSR